MLTGVSSAERLTHPFYINTLRLNHQYSLHMKQTASRVIAWIMLVLSLVFFSSTGVLAQDNKPTIERQGNVFVQKSSRSSNGQVTKTNYIYEDSKGQRDTIYISPTGKAFVFKVSKKTGNIYKKYLPEVTAQLQKEGKIDEKH